MCCVCVYLSAFNCVCIYLFAIVCFSLCVCVCLRDCVCLIVLFLYACETAIMMRHCCNLSISHKLCSHSHQVDVSRTPFVDDMTRHDHQSFPLAIASISHSNNVSYGCVYLLKMSNQHLSVCARTSSTTRS